MNRLMVFVLSLLAFGIVSCQSSQKSKDPNWSESMQGLADEVQELVPYVYSRSRFLNEDNETLISKRLSKFADSVHEVPSEQGQIYLGDDPLVKFSLTQMESDLQRAQTAFRLGRKRYARGVVKTAMNHCFRCHSTTQVGSKAHWKISSFSELSLSPLEATDLMVATRNYKKALENLQATLVDSEFAKTKPFEYESALKKYLALSIRIEKNPRKTLLVFKQVAAVDGVPQYLRAHVFAWQKALEDWAKQKDRGNLQGTATLARAEALLRSGKNSQTYQKDHAGDVDYLRASEQLHTLLKTPMKSSAKKARVYLLLGETYEVLDELGYWGLHEVYYESCVRAVPKTKLARNCFQRLQASVYFGYSGSSGLHLPASEKQRLSELKKILN